MTSAALLLAWALADPPVDDARRFPPPAELADGIRFSNQYRYYWHCQKELWPEHAGRIERLRAEAECLCDLWHDAYYATWEGNPEDLRRAALRRLRTRIGPDAYRRAELPPPVPLWRFGELR